ncbi:MAG: penicillin acylase family protein [Acidobacteriota bacterium]
MKIYRKLFLIARIFRIILGMSARPRRTFRIVPWSLAAVLSLLTVAGAVFYVVLRASLPELDGTRQLPGLKDRAVVERDDLGVPTIRARSRVDAARVTGFLHAQDRFFQMDLSRRMGAGELAELLGPAVLDADRRFRLHRLRAAAREAIRRMPASHLELARAYTEGVNAGLAALGARPPEYLILRSQPAPWLPEDCLLVGYAMFFFLQDSRGRQETDMSLLAQILPPKAFDFFLPAGTEWDAAIDATDSPLPAIPSAEEFSFSDLPPASAGILPATGPQDPCLLTTWGPSVDFVAGSNSWAVDGKLSTSGSALLANDMHLGLRLPNTWYRMRIICDGGLDITGVTIPGVPAVIVGSNRRIAWTFTNSTLDLTDLILLEISPDNPRLYRTPGGWLPFRKQVEILRVRGGADQEMAIETTIWGPVLPASQGSKKRVVRWIGQLPAAVDLGILELEQAGDVEMALAIAPRCGVPTQNFVVGDRAGRIGWTLIGRLPHRVGFDGRLPVSWADGSKRWDGFVKGSEYPRVESPPEGRIWTANNRVAGSPAYLSAGPWDVDLGARARQIRDDLQAQSRFGPEDMLAIQLDNRAVFLRRWRELLLSTLELSGISRVKGAGEVRRLVQNWGGRASIDSAGYRLVRGFRSSCLELLLAPLTDRCKKIDREFQYPTRQVEHCVWVLLNEKPMHLLNPAFESYEGLLVSALEKTMADLSAQGLTAPEATWGERNRVAVRHPLSQGIPLVGRWLDIETESLPGDSHMPRFQSPGSGASERLSVSPGHEEEGLFHMPGGQSGHFLSRYYRKGHEAWASGKPMPFLPGPARHTLTLAP